jgi:pimeloyl-ACP methyl ester carboxylesterase
MAKNRLLPTPRPARDYAEAAARVAALQAHDTAEIKPISRLQFLTHGHRVERAIALFHGYTNSPAQFRQLGQALFERGYNVLIPRLPHHGLPDRLTTRHALLTAEELVELAAESIDIALGLGERVTVAGLSMGGVMAGWTAQERPEVERAVLIAPGFGLYPLPAILVRPATHLFLRMPNFFIWWDPKLKDKVPDPGYGYPRYATHALAQMLRLGAAVRARARGNPPAARSIVLVTNANDLAVDNCTTCHLGATWQRHGGQVQTYEFAADLMLPHDLIDPKAAGQKIDAVYPVLLELIQGG